jgi:hypothetical protein
MRVEVALQPKWLLDLCAMVRRLIDNGTQRRLRFYSSCYRSSLARGSDFGPNVKNSFPLHGALNFSLRHGPYGSTSSLLLQQ